MLVYQRVYTIIINYHYHIPVICKKQGNQALIFLGSLSILRIDSKLPSDGSYPPNPNSSPTTL